MSSIQGESCPIDDTAAALRARLSFISPPFGLLRSIQNKQGNVID